MSRILPTRTSESDRIVLRLLESVERESAQSQRRLAAELGIAIGLVNAYLKRCVKKGLVKMSEAPARRYVGRGMREDLEIGLGCVDVTPLAFVYS